MAFESLYRSTLAQRLEASATEIVVATAPTVTNGRMRVIRGNTTEFISYTWVTQNTNNATLTWVTRGLSQTADPATWGTWQTFAAGSQIVLVAMHDQLADKSSDTSYNWTQTFTNLVVDNQITIPRYADEAARDAWIPTPVNGMSIYRIDLGLYEDYTAWSWQTRAVAWADRLVAATGSDTTPWTLDQKANAWDGIATEVLNPGANEQIDIKVDILETNWLQITGGQLDINAASNTQVWTQRIATDSEVISWTLENVSINPKQAKDNYETKWVVLSGSLLFDDDAQSNIVIAHWLQVIPRNIILNIDRDANNIIRWWFYSNNNWVSTQLVFRPSEWIYANGLAVYDPVSINDRWTWSVSSVDETNVTLSYSFIWSFSSTTALYSMQITT